MPTQLRDIWSASSDYRTWYQTNDEVETIVRLLDLGDARTLVDVGCGNGAFSIAAARANPYCKVRAFDALESAIAQCKSAAADLGADRFEVGQAWAESLPLPDACADRILCRAVLHHVADVSAAYREMARVLKPGGLLLLQMPGNYWGKRWSQFISDMYMLADDSHRRYYYQPAEVIAALNEVGLFMRSAQCWTYTSKDLNEAQVALLRQHKAEERFNLRRSSEGTWDCDFFWIRVIAIKGE